RRLAVAARGDEEDLLPFRQVTRQPVALLLAIGERRRRHHLAVDERVRGSHDAIIRNHYVMLRNIAKGGGPGPGGAGPPFRRPGGRNRRVGTAAAACSSLPSFFE